MRISRFYKENAHPMIGIVVPAHNEEAAIDACLHSLGVAVGHPSLQGERAEIVVVLDACTDATHLIAEAHDVQILTVEGRNVGMARAAGAEALLARGAAWLAFTDADTVVTASWLADQLSLCVDVVCGTVSVADWTPHGDHASLLEWHFRETYSDQEGHSHVHGANLGVSAAAYRRAGGFQHLRCGEDVALVNALAASGASIAWSAKPRVVTSARRDARAAGGFADALINAVAQRLEAAAQPRLSSAAPPLGV